MMGIWINGNINIGFYIYFSRSQPSGIINNAIYRKKEKYLNKNFEKVKINADEFEKLKTKSLLSKEQLKTPMAKY
mgnify:CR=1 FL=1